MKTSDAFPSNYLKASDLGNQHWTLTIDDIRQEELQSNDGRKQKKPVLYFRRTKKGLVLNVTNSRTIEHSYGDEMDDWIGRDITLFVREVEARGETVNAIRVRVPQPGQSTVPAHLQPRPETAPSRFASGLPDEPGPGPRRPAAEHPRPGEFQGMPPSGYSERNPPPHPGRRDDMDDEIPF
ncbi:MAG TPA: hypothetical protein VF748_07540 [Candidatus Acidoferrum sp.]